MAPTPRSRTIEVLAILAMILPALAPALGAAESPGIPSPDLAHLESIQPGWTIVSSEGSATSGKLRMERKVWPMLYLHWWPWEESMGRTIGAEAAAERVAGIWEGLVIDSPLEGREIALPQHPGFLFETTTSSGKWSARYVVWYCPESFRIFVADANLSLTIAAPETLLDWQVDVVRSVRCHTTASIEGREHLTSRRNLPGGDLALDLPAEWVIVPGYRVQPDFAGMNFKSEMPRSTALRGQALFLARDAVREFSLFWSSEEDFPMSYDVLQKKVEEFWRQLATEMMILGSSVVGGLWRMDGVVVYTPEGLPFHVPAGRFRGWMWREGDVTYFAMGAITPTRFGRRDPEYDWGESFDRMLKDLGF